MTRYPVEIVVDGGTARIDSRLDSKLARALSQVCSYQAISDYALKQLRSRGDRWSNSSWDGRARLFEMVPRAFPSGLLSLVCGALAQRGHPVQVTETPRSAVSVAFPAFGVFESRQYQDSAVVEAVGAKRAVLRVATGGGKTKIAGDITATVGQRTLFLVHTKDLLYQAIDMFSAMFGPEYVGQIGDGQVRLAPMTVATLQTMSRVFGVGYERYEYDDAEEWDDRETSDVAKIPEWASGVGLVFMDECHRVAAPTALGVMAALRNPVYRIGLSASPWRDDGADMAIQACFGEVAFSRSASDLVEEGYLVPAIIRQLQVPPMRFPSRERYDTIYRRYVVENEERNAMGVREAVRMVQRGIPTLILVVQIKHGKEIQKLVSEELGVWVPFLQGKDSAKERKKVLDGIRSRKLGCFVATVIADEGLDLKPLGGLVLMGAGKSSVRALQRVGRTLRPNPGKSVAEIVDFDDRALHLVGHSAARHRLYDTESSWTVIDY